MPASIWDIWDDPTRGLTISDFARWPAVNHGLDRLSRDNKMAALLQGALENGHLTLPVYLVGQCSTYDTPHGHPSFQGAIHDFVTFVVSGTPGTSYAGITTMKKGLLSKRVASELLPEFDNVELEEFDVGHGGYVDMQMSRSGSPTARIGIYWSRSQVDGYGIAHQRIQAIGDALIKCRAGLLPNQ